MGRRHGHQALDSGEGHGAALGGPHQAAADAVLAVVLRRRGEDAVGAEAFRGHGHAVCGVEHRRELVKDGFCHLVVAVGITEQTPEDGASVGGVEENHHLDSPKPQLGTGLPRRSAAAVKCDRN